MTRDSSAQFSALSIRPFYHDHENNILGSDVDR